MSCEHAPFALPDDAESQEESAGVQLHETERPLFYCCFCRKLLLPNRWPLLLACLHSCCRECAVEKAKGATVGDKARGSSSSAASAASSEASAGDDDAVQRQIASYLAAQHDSALVRRRLRNAASAALVDLPPCDACTSEAGCDTATRATANPANEWCEACSMHLCCDCKEWHRKFNPKHEVTAVDRYESGSSSSSSQEMRPHCMHYATAIGTARPSGNSIAALDILCITCRRLRCAQCRSSCLSEHHTFHDVADRLQQEQQVTAAGAEAFGLAKDARLEIGDRLMRLESHCASDIATNAERARHQVLQSYKLSVSEVKRQKYSVLRELEEQTDAFIQSLDVALDEAEGLLKECLKIGDQLGPDVELTRSYCDLLLSSTSDSACILDQKAVVVSHLDCVLEKTHEAGRLVQQAAAVATAGSRPSEFIANLMTRLQGLHQQNQTGASLVAAAAATGPDSGAALSVVVDDPVTVAAAATISASSGKHKDKVVEISNDIAEEQPNAPVTPPSFASMVQPPAAPRPATQPVSRQQQRGDAITAGPVLSQQPPPPSTLNERVAAMATSTSSGDAAAHTIERKPTTTSDRSLPEAVVQNAIEEGVLDNGGSFSDLSRQPQTQQQPPRQQPPQQQPTQQRPPQQRPPQQPQQRSQQQPPQHRPPQQQPSQQQPAQQQRSQQQPPPQRQQSPQPQQPAQQQQPAQHQQERQAQRGEQPQQMSASEPEVYRAAGRPTGSVRVMHDCRDVALAPNGHLLLAALKVGLIELDASGREVSRWTPPPTDEGQTDTASTVEVLCDAEGDEGSWCAVVGLMDSQSVVLLRRSNAAVGGNGDPTLLPPWTLDGEPIMLRAAPIRLAVCQPGLLAVAGAHVSVTHESQQRGGKSKDHSSGLVVRRSWSPGPYLDAMQLADGQSRVCETLGYCIQGVTVTPRIVAALSNDTQRNDDGQQRYVIDAFCLITGRRLWRHGMDSEPSDLCTSLPQPGSGAADVVLYAALQHADRVVALRARNGADAGELLSEQGNGVHVPFRIALAQIGLQATVAVLTARREVLLYPVS